MGFLDRFRAPPRHREPATRPPAGDKGGPERETPGTVRGRHFTEWVETVKELRRRGDEEAAEELLLSLIDATEAEDRVEKMGVAPWYYEQLATSYRKRGQVRQEVAILERYAAQRHAPGVTPPKLLHHLERARERLSGQSDGST